jgi:energy-coupling factor transporter ATP-binding protein EcfA2
LDETFKSLSADKKIKDLIAVLQEYVKQTGKQFIFITHKADVYGAIADKILLTELFDKTTKVSEVTLQQIIQDYTFNFELKEDEVEN